MNNIVFYKLINNEYVKINALDYALKYYCGNIHWINIITGREEDIYMKDGTYFKKSVMEVETRIMVINKLTEESQWRDFVFNIKDVRGCYSSENGKNCILLIDGGECQVDISYQDYKNIVKVANSHNKLVQLN